MRRKERLKRTWGRTNNNKTHMDGKGRSMAENTEGECTRMAQSSPLETGSKYLFVVLLLEVVRVGREYHDHSTMTSISKT